MALSVRDSLHSLLEIPAMARLLSLPSGKRVLQIGCGTGAGLPDLARHCKPVSLTGIDVSTDALSQAAGLLREERVTASLVHADAHRMPFSDASFDVVVDFGTCHRVADTDAVLQEIARILVADGIFVQETTLAQMPAHPLWSLHHGRSSFGIRPLTPGRNAALWRSCAKFGRACPEGQRRMVR